MSRNVSNSTNCTMPRTNTKFSDRSFSVVRPSIWNSPETYAFCYQLALFQTSFQDLLFQVDSFLIRVRFLNFIFIDFVMRGRFRLYLVGQYA